MTKVRTRFAPSPTGMLHIGGLRSAVFAWLLARRHGGDFILRIEDTDQERKVPGAIAYILESFEWLGIDLDEGPSREELERLDGGADALPDLGGPFGPYVQSSRLERYQQVADQLIESGHAYRCDCTPEMLQKDREEQTARKETPGYVGRCRDRQVSEDSAHVVRFRMPDAPQIEMEDGVRGLISWDSVPLRDPVLQKGDRFPTYHLAVVVDDHDMEISHAMRGEEWIPSSPLHLLLYKALDWTPPVFCHLPVVLGDDGKKLSKRHGSTSWSSFRDEGYLPEAVLNYLALVGWSPGDDREVMTRSEMIEAFSLDQVNAASAVFDYTKLTWMNGVYMRNLESGELLQRCQPYLIEQGIEISDQRWKIIAPHVQERAKLLPEVPGMVSFLQDKPLTRDLSLMMGKKLDQETAVALLRRVESELQKLDTFDPQLMEERIKPLAAEFEVKLGPVFVLLRVALTGEKGSLPLFDCMAALGREETLSRVAESIQLLLGSGE